jgi:hypothetical protein
MTVVVARVPHRWTTGPEPGSPTTEPVATARSTRPSSPAERCRESRTCGIREAQLANTNPQPMNAIDVARVALRMRGSPVGTRAPVVTASQQPCGRSRGDADVLGFEVLLDRLDAPSRPKPPAFIPRDGADG